MPAVIPLKVVKTAGNTTGLAEFQTGDVVPESRGGTGQTTLAAALASSGLVRTPVKLYASGDVWSDIAANAAFSSISLTKIANDRCVITNLGSYSLKFVCQAEGSNGGTLFSDGAGHSITATGITTSTADKYFGSSSAYSDGTNNNRLSSTSADYNFGSGNFTIRGKVKMLSGSPSNGCLFDNRIGGATGIAIYADSNGYLTIANNSTIIITQSAGFNSYAWKEWAVVRSSGVLYLFAGGTYLGQVADNRTYNGSTFYLFSSGSGQTFKGYLDDICIHNTALYTATYTPLETPTVYGQGYNGQAYFEKVWDGIAWQTIFIEEQVRNSYVVSDTSTRQLLADNISGVSAATNGMVFQRKSTGEAGFDLLTLVEYTWAGKPTASGNSGKYIRITDFNAIYRSDGTNWIPISDIQFFNSSIPVIVINSWTAGDNGALTNIPTLPISFTGGTDLAACYIYFPTNGIKSGSAAGFYYVVLSSATAGTVYNNTYTPGTNYPTIPASTTAFSGTGAGAQTFSGSVTAVSVTIPALAIGKYGYLTINASHKTSNTILNLSMLINGGGGTISESTTNWAGNRILLSFINTVARYVNEKLTDNATYKIEQNFTTASPQNQNTFVLSINCGITSPAASFILHSSQITGVYK